MDQLIFASLSHTHYWYEVVSYSMLKVPAYINCTISSIVHPNCTILFIVQFNAVALFPAIREETVSPCKLRGYLRVRTRSGNENL